MRPRPQASAPIVLWPAQSPTFSFIVRNEVESIPVHCIFSDAKGWYAAHEKIPGFDHFPTDHIIELSLDSSAGDILQAVTKLIVAKDRPVASSLPPASRKLIQ